MTREVAEVCMYLKTKSINIPTTNDWLISCVECFKEQGTYSMNEIKELVYQQWLLADLADIGVGVIPNNCFIDDKFVLQGRYAVQLNYFVNVAVSFHKQLQTIRRPDVLKNLEVDCETPSGPQNRPEPTGNRILKMEITDGVVTILAFEDQFIPSLHEPYVPGKKAILVGPIECRKQILFLRPKNIIILGGEVDALLIPNATENILARKLKLPENPDPYTQQLFGEKETIGEEASTLVEDDEEAMMMLAEEIERKVPDINSSVTSYSSGNQQNSARQVVHVSSSNYVGNSVSQCENPRSQSGPTRQSGNPGPPRQTVHSEPTRQTVITGSSTQMVNPGSIRQTVNPGFNKEAVDTSASKNAQHVFSVPNQISDLVFDDDFDLLDDQSVASVEKSQNDRKQGVDEVASKFRAYEIFDPTLVKKDFQEITELKKKLNESYKTAPAQSSTSDKRGGSLVWREDGKIIVDYLSDNDSPLTCLSAEADTAESTPNSSQSEPLAGNDISLEPFPPRKRPSIVTAMTRVVKVLKKPKLKDDKWSVSALVEAKGMEVEVTFDSHVIDKVFTVSAAEIISKRELLCSDPVMKQKFNETLKQSQYRFSKLACDMTFHFKDAISNPVIIDIKVDR